MFKVTTEGIVSVVREPSPWGMRYDLLLEEMEGLFTWEIELLFVLSPESDKLQQHAATTILVERGVCI